MNSARRRTQSFVDFVFTNVVLSQPYSNIAQVNFASSLIKKTLNNSTIICLNGVQDISRLTIFINFLSVQLRTLLSYRVIPNGGNFATFKFLSC